MPDHRPQVPVRNIHHVLWYGDADEHTVGFIVHMVLARPPNAGAQSLAGCGNNGIAFAIGYPLYAAVPWRALGKLWFSCVENFN